MTRARLPMSVTASIALHTAGLVAWMHLSQAAARQNLRVISNVDLMIQVRRQVALPKPMAKAATPPSTWNFLKMALPSVPKVAPQRLEVKVPQAKKLREVQPKLEDRGRKAAAPKLEALEMGEKKTDMAKVEARLEPKRVAVLAAVPRLEEVGRRQVRNLPQAIALEERRQEAAALQSIEKMNVPTHRYLAPAAAMLTEAGPQERSRLSAKIAKFLPQREESLEFKPQMAAAPDAIAKKLNTFVAPPGRREAQALEEKKKGVEIEGPLAGRMVASYDVPEFPAWARDQGILEAAVSIRFWVAKEGDVLPGMTVERTSGYGRLDRLAMESLRRWKFAALAAERREWGVITFRFVLE